MRVKWWLNFSSIVLFLAILGPRGLCSGHPLDGDQVLAEDEAKAEDNEILTDADDPGLLDRRNDAADFAGVDITDELLENRKTKIVEKILDLVSRKTLEVLEKSDNIDESKNEIAQAEDVSNEVKELFSEASMDELEQAIKEAENRIDTVEVNYKPEDLTLNNKNQDIDLDLEQNLSETSDEEEYDPIVFIETLNKFPKEVENSINNAYENMLEK